MERIQVQVVRGGRYGSGDGFQVYGDSGGGGMDWVRPLTARRQLLWPDAPPVAGHLIGGHLASGHLDAVRPAGHLGGCHLLDEHLRPAAAVVWESPAVVFGRFRLAVVMEDAAGNADPAGARVCEQVVNSGPPPARGLVPKAHDAVDGRLTLRFTPSPRLVG